MKKTAISQIREKDYCFVAIRDFPKVNRSATVSLRQEIHWGKE